MFLLCVDVKWHVLQSASAIAGSILTCFAALHVACYFVLQAVTATGCPHPCLCLCCVLVVGFVCVVAGCGDCCGVLADASQGCGRNDGDQDLVWLIGGVIKRSKLRPGAHHCRQCVGAGCRGNGRSAEAPAPAPAVTMPWLQQLSPILFVLPTYCHVRTDSPKPAVQIWKCMRCMHTHTDSEAANRGRAQFRSLL